MDSKSPRPSQIPRVSSTKSPADDEPPWSSPSALSSPSPSSSPSTTSSHARAGHASIPSMTGSSSPGTRPGPSTAVPRPPLAPPPPNRLTLALTCPQHLRFLSSRLYHPWTSSRPEDRAETSTSAVPTRTSDSGSLLTGSSSIASSIDWVTRILLHQTLSTKLRCWPPPGAAPSARPPRWRCLV